MDGRKDDIVCLLATFSSAIVRTLAPRADLLDISTSMVGKTGSDKRARQAFLLQSRQWFPCLSSPAAKPSHWM